MPLEEYPRFIYGEDVDGNQVMVRVGASGGVAPVVQETTLHASGEETSTKTGSDVDVADIVAANFYLDVTAEAGDSTETLDVKIQEKDPVSGKYFDIVTFTQIGNATGNERKSYGNGSGELLGKTIRYVATIANGGASVAYTFSLSMVGQS